MSKVICGLALAVSVLVLSACSSQRALMPAPNVYQGGEAKALFTGLPESLRGSEVDLFYVTDRQPEKDENGNMVYGYGRSPSLAFGTARIALEPEMSWEDLERVSLMEKRDPELTLRLVGIEEIGRYPDTPYNIVRVNGKLQTEPATLQRVAETTELAEAALESRLADSPKKEIVLFVHGFNNDFEYAAGTAAELWHFLGREHIMVLYTWPAGRGGVRGYTYDRESGEFTVYHLKRTIERLATMPGVEKVHLVAHSRGTDVLTTAVRELIFEYRNTDMAHIPLLNIENLVLAAPDLDMEVTLQRLASDQLNEDIGDVAIYTFSGDKAIGASAKLFSSKRRMGRVNLSDVADHRKEVLASVEGLAFIDLAEAADTIGHGYFHNSPEASSDLVLTIRYGLKPGRENGRPLAPLGLVFWRLEKGYPDTVQSD